MQMTKVQPVLAVESDFPYLLEGVEEEENWPRMLESEIVDLQNQKLILNLNFLIV